MSIFTSHPGKAIWVLGAVLVTLAKLPMLSIYYLFQRPDPRWTVRQALMNNLMRAFLYHSAVVQVKTPLNLEPGAEGKRFVLIPAIDQRHLKGVLDDDTIRPATTGGTWFPSLPPDNYSGKVILHLHGGGYAIGEGRIADGAYAGKMLTENVAPFALFAQYRLASNSGGRFPAALQDALSSYAFLLAKGYKAGDIVISGDSAGGHLALSLLRYLSTAKVELPAPRALLLWSTSIDLEVARDSSWIDSSEFYATDYLIGNFSSWGAGKFTEGLDLAEGGVRPYVVQLGYPFRSVSPIWICIGSLEILGPAAIRMGKELKDEGNVVETHVISGAPHDVMFVGNILGFGNEALEATKVAHRFVEDN